MIQIKKITYFFCLFFVLFWTIACTTSNELTKQTTETIQASDASVERQNELVNQLCKLYGFDQGIRDRGIWGVLEKEAILKIDSLNFEKFIQIVKEYGFPNEKILGDRYKAYECVELSAVAIMLHNPSKIINSQELFDLFLGEIDKGNLNRKAFAMFLDKHYWHKSSGEKVMYGSQFGIPCLDTKEETNRLRNEIGLEALKDEEFKVCE